VGEDRHKVEEIYNIPSIDIWAYRSNEQDFGATSKGLQPKASEDLG